MNRKFVILRSDGQTRGGGGAARVRAIGAAEATLDVAEMSAPEAATRARDGSTLALAPVMPMRLIEPTAEGPAAQPAAGTIAWGVRAVAAPESPFDGTGVVVAVLDTGINPNHQAFAGV